MARWKARGRLYIRRNWTFFAISYGWDVMSGNRSKSALFKGVGYFERRFQREGASPINHCWYQSSRVIALSCGIKISAVRHLVLSQSTRVTYRRTYRITTPKTALAYAREVKNENKFAVWSLNGWCYKHQRLLLGLRHLSMAAHCALPVSSLLLCSLSVYPVSFPTTL